LFYKNLFIVTIILRFFGTAICVWAFTLPTISYSRSALVHDLDALLTG
jgi:hypothetical protein